MRLFKSKEDILIENNTEYYIIKNRNWDQLVNRKGLHAFLLSEISNGTPISSNDFNAINDFDAPIGSQEVWAAGVTYLKSKQARMEESKINGGASFYDLVYEAERPELFFKSTAERVVGPGKDLNIRRDSKWNVPEPELTLFISSYGTIEGYSIGNDMSSRDIEGENPLYLPQAKMYDKCAGLGPALFVPKEPISPDTKISLIIERGNTIVFEGEISINQMKRSHTELAGFLFRETTFSKGVYLMTGTCLVPEDDFTLAVNDVVKISISNIGTLINTISKKA